MRKVVSLFDYTGNMVAPWVEAGYEAVIIVDGGGFNMPMPDKAAGLGEPDNRIHAAPPSAHRANFRSATPMGFARAVFAANHKRTT